MKKLFVLLTMIFILNCVCGCESEVDRSYEKIAADYHLDYYHNYPESDDKVPEITCYDDMVKYSKKLYYSKFGCENNDPYVVMFDESNDCWFFVNSRLRVEDGNIVDDNPFRVCIASNGDVISGVFPKESPFCADDYEPDLSNEFTFSYKNFEGFVGYTLYNEKLDEINSADDVIDVARYLYEKWNLNNKSSAYAVCYDKENDCWLYNEPCGIEFIIRSDGQILLMNPLTGLQ